MHSNACSTFEFELIVLWFKKYWKLKIWYRIHSFIYVKRKIVYAVVAIIVNGNQVFTNPMNPTYFPKKNIQAASRIIFQDVDPRYFINLSASPQWLWLKQSNHWITIIKWMCRDEMNSPVIPEQVMHSFWVFDGSFFNSIIPDFSSTFDHVFIKN